MFGWVGFVVGILFIVVGGFLVFFFPASMEHQSDVGSGSNMALSGVVLGLILLVVGFFLAFWG